MVLVVVLQVGLIFLLVHEDEAENVSIEVRLPDFDVLVQLHEVIAVNRVDVEVIYVTVGAGMADANPRRTSVNSREKSGNMLKE